MFTYGGNAALKRNNFGTRVPLPMAIARFFEREAYLNRQQRSQSQRTPDKLLVLLEDDSLAFMSLTEVRNRGLRVVQHPLNYNHLFDASQLVDVGLTLPSTELTLNESFNKEVEVGYTIPEPAVEILPEEPTTDVV